MKNLKKDLAHGEGNRVADGATLLQEGNADSDHAHVVKQTPLKTKMKEMESDTETPDIKPDRQARTTRLRRDKDVKPL